MIISSFLLENQNIITENTEFQNNFTKFFTVITILILIFVIIVLIFNCLIKSYFQNTSELLEKQVKNQIEYYKTIDKLNEEIREFRHDYKNHISCLQALLEKGEYDDACDYVRDITNKSIIESNGFFTGNKIADSILTDKSKSDIAITHNIHINFDGVIHESISAADLCIILSNAIDNAVEACLYKTDNSIKTICIKCVFIQNIQIIRIENPVFQMIEINNNNVSTTKDDNINHGYGLYNIKRTIEKFNGDFSISCDNNKFILEVMFQIT